MAEAVKTCPVKDCTNTCLHGAAVCHACWRNIPYELRLRWRWFDEKKATTPAARAKLRRSIIRAAEAAVEVCRG